MKNELIKLASHLDKKGFHTEADYLDVLVKRAGEPVVSLEELDEIFPDKEPHSLDTGSISAIVDEALGQAEKMSGGAAGGTGKNVGQIITELLEVSKQGDPAAIEEIIKDLDPEKLQAIISELLLGVGRTWPF